MQIDTPLGICDRPCNEFVFGFTGLPNFIPVEVSGKSAAVERRTYLGDIVDYLVKAGGAGDRCRLGFGKARWFPSP